MIVLLKVVLSNVSTLVGQANGTNATTLSFVVEDSISPDNGMPANNVDLFKQIHNEKMHLPNGHRSENHQKKSSTLEDLNLVRLREITSKAVAGIIFMLLKWFKLSRKSSSSTIVVDADCSRHTQVRVPNSAASGLQLHALSAEILCTSRRRQSSRPEERSRSSRVS